MNGLYRTVLMLYIKDTFSHPEHTCFVLRNKYLKILKILRREQKNLNFPKKGLKNETICNVIQDIISLWKDELEAVIENIGINCSIENKSYYWLSYDGLKKNYLN